MAAGGGRAAILAVAAAALAAGGGAGWLAGRATFPPAPPPRTWVNPMVDAAREEVLVIEGPGGATQGFRILDTVGDTLLLSVEDIAPDGRTSTRQFRVARHFFGAFVILEGDIDPQSAESTIRDFVVKQAVIEDLRVDSLDRTFRCLKVTGRYRSLEDRTYWITDELPVQGVARVDGSRGKMFEVRSFSFGKGK